MARPARARIVVITTGGTIGGEAGGGGPIGKGQGARDWAGRILAYAPGLEEQVELQFDDFMNLFSEDMIPLDWARLARQVGKWAHQGVDGIVISHGTDTLAYSSAALSFLLANAPFPVVVTGATIPFKTPGSDGIANLCNSIVVAAEPGLQGVFVVFASTVHLGTRVRKMASTAEAFKSIHHAPLGTVRGLDVELAEAPAFPRRGDGRFEVAAGLDPGVAFFKVYPGFAPLWLELALRQQKAILLELYLDGSACTLEGSPYSLKPALEEAWRRGIPVFATSQQESTLDLTLYVSTSRLYEAGVVSLRDMTTEAALPKLMWILGQTADADEIKDLMLTNLANEIREPERPGFAAEQPQGRLRWQDVLGDDPRLAGTRALGCQLESLVRSLFPLASDQDRILDALSVMICLHRDQKARPDGTPYASHPLEVALYVLSRFGRSDPDVLMAALLHDAVEDQADKLVAPCVASGLSRRALRQAALEALEQRFGTRVAELAGLLVNPDPEEASGILSGLDDAEQEAYKHRLYREHFRSLWDGDPDALLIKLADFSQNALRLDRLEEGSKKDRLRRKYGHVLAMSVARLEQLEDPGHPLFGARGWLLENLREAYARDYDDLKGSTV